MRRSKSLRFFDFSGGLNTSAATTSLGINEAIDLQNINLLSSQNQQKCGFQKRQGNSVFNSSAMVGSSTAISGLGYFRLSTGSDFLMAIAGTKIFSSSSLSGTMADVSGSVTITGGQNNIWTHSVMNDLSIFVGGAPDAPIKYSGSGNAAVLGGSPVSANFGIVANNRFFLGNTSANPSRIYWSILGNPQDWSSSGSGSQDVQTNDGDQLIGASQLGVDHLLLFKQNSIHDLVIRNAPFPLFPLFRNVGAVSKRGIVTVDGITYFITPQPRMKATDGTKIIDFPDTINTVWDGLNKSRLSYIHGTYYPRRRQIMWICSNGSASTHDYCIIWDLNRKCWLRHMTGYKMNASVMAQDNLLYTGAYDGKIYKQDVDSLYTDASETSPGAINAFWKSGWYDVETMTQMKNVPYVDVNFTTQTTGNFDFGLTYDFITQPSVQTISMQSPGDKWKSLLWDSGMWGDLSDRSKILFTKGRGKFVQFFVRNQNQGENISFNGFEVPMKIDAPYAVR